MHGVDVTVATELQEHGKVVITVSAKYAPGSSAVKLSFPAVVFVGHLDPDGALRV